MPDKDQWQAICPLGESRAHVCPIRDTEDEALEDAHAAAQKYGKAEVYLHEIGSIGWRELKLKFTVTAPEGEAA
ncbi:Uncharacterised protein (plasmid) [Tsukamurella tyrosinosolvens]|uniref:Uncharacterized protein n=1 Tax=Tsukamurella tyrosinosolvens TaxID=57704 RepID=A0A1H4V541_TSUTY|nr:hypothetical protein [Tsukamurella tyrosinosolvens]KXO91054.1 hypothetical protein AXK58_21730 [Tsukamurella tyrosinosolvens]SEC75758.1 hypothetical protein SAMN04489793_3135 [Tsukamurella tyrosinosolvens]VEH90694.1 Uncharacterised protein [Tsukamurella tyrosinosolvens]